MPSQEAVNIYSKVEASFDVYDFLWTKIKMQACHYTPITYSPLEGPHSNPRGCSRARQAHEVGRANV